MPLILWGRQFQGTFYGVHQRLPNVTDWAPGAHSITCSPGTFHLAFLLTLPPDSLTPAFPKKPLKHPELSPCLRLCLWGYSDWYRFLPVPKGTHMRMYIVVLALIRVAAGFWEAWMGGVKTEEGTLMLTRAGRHTNEQTTQEQTPNNQIFRG